MVFSKNENDVSKSIGHEDFEFLKTLPDVNICYEPRLHDKFNASEDFSIITSMNLHQFSSDINIEVGINLKSSKWLQQLSSSTIDNETYKYFNEVIENAETVFRKEASCKGGLLGFNQSFSHSEIIVDNTDSFF